MVLYYSTDRLGLERWKSIFVPALGNMAERDLQLMEQVGGEAWAEAQQCRQGMAAFFEKKGIKAQLSAWHVWARKPHAPGER